MVWILLGVTKVLPQANTFYGLVTKHILTSEWWELLSRITWLIDNWPINWLTDSLSVAKRLMDWLTEYYWLCNITDLQMTICFPDWLIHCLSDWQSDLLSERLFGWPTDWLTDRLTTCMTAWLIGWISACLAALLPF